MKFAFCHIAVLMAYANATNIQQESENALKQIDAGLEPGALTNMAAATDVAVDSQ